MQEFQAGQVVYHKATSKRCVVIRINEDGTVKVRTADDQERDYHTVELKPQESAIVHRKGGNLY